MPKDNESIPFLGDLSVEPAEPRGFSPDEMVRCEACLRANPPTRVTCLYCGKALPVTASSKALARPSFRPLEKWEQGYNNILIPSAGQHLSHDVMGQVASLLRLEAGVVERIFSAPRPLPLARTAAEEEALLVEERLCDLGVEAIVVSDRDLGLETAPTRRARGLELRESHVVLHDLAGKEQSTIAWSELNLLVVARLFAKRVELKERKRRNAESVILESSETSSDEAVIDIYSQSEVGGWRVAANSFDFSCLGSRKTLLASENFSTLVEAIRERSLDVECDDLFDSLRPVLEPVWPSEQETQAAGWRREWLGKFSTGEIVTTTNELQFTRYSRLRHYLRSRSLGNKR